MCACIYIFMALSEMLIGFGFSLFSGMTIAQTQENQFTFAIGTLSSKFLAYIFTLFIRKKSFMVSNNPLGRCTLLLFSLPTASLLIMLVFLMSCYKIDDLGYSIMVIISSGVLIFANFMVFEIMNRQNRMMENEMQLSFYEKYLQSQKLHYEELYQHQNELHNFRHDTKNTLISLIGLLKAGETEKAVGVMEKSLDFLTDGGIVDSHNPVIDALLQAKINSAKESGIELKSFIRLEYPIEIDEIELGIVLGNALDNAIEAAEKITDSGSKTINCQIITVSGLIVITVENPIEQKIDTKALETTKADKSLHGYGVKSIKSIASRYGGTADFECNENKFTVRINMVNKKV